MEKMNTTPGREIKRGRKGRTSCLHRVRLGRVERGHRGGPSGEREENDGEVDGGAHSRWMR